MIEAPLALAFGAGLVATLNPCGFAMLPAYLSYFMGASQEEDLSRAASLRRALVVGGVMSVAFLVVFGVTGLAITLGFRAVIDWIPWIALGVGGLIVLLGIAMLFGYELTVGLPKAGKANKGTGLRSVFGFGISYGLASLSCTLPVFLSVVATQLTASSLLTGVSTFIVYGLGMSMMLLGITLVMAFGKQTILTRLRSSARYINKISGAVLVLAGAYIVWFWGTALTSGAGALNNSGAFRFFETLSQRATETFGENALLWGVVLGGLIAATAAYAFLKDRLSSGGGPDQGSGSGDPSPKPNRRLVRGIAVAAVLAVAAGGFILNTGSSDGGTVAMANEDESSAGISAAPAGDPAPTTSFLRFDGTSATLADYRGTPLVVNFWASWCPSCVAELTAAIRPAQDRFGDEVGFIGVNLQDDREAALELIAETGVQFDLVEDADGTLYTQFEAIGMPFTAFIAPDGSIIDTHNGPLTEGQLADKITELLAVGSAVPETAGGEDTTEADPGVAAAGPEVIVEANPDLPATLAGLRGWNTDFGRRTIDLNELVAGIRSSDPRDVIPPLDFPEYETVATASEWLEGREPGVLIEIGDDVRFFPLRIMTFHEIVNDTIGGRPVVVTFCPLCNTAVVFDPTVGGDVLRFGVSGLLRFSDLVM